MLAERQYSGRQNSVSHGSLLGIEGYENRVAHLSRASLRTTDY